MAGLEETSCSGATGTPCPSRDGIIHRSRAQGRSLDRHKGHSKDRTRIKGSGGARAARHGGSSRGGVSTHVPSLHHKPWLGWGYAGGQAPRHRSTDRHTDTCRLLWGGQPQTAVTELWEAQSSCRESSRQAGDTGDSVGHRHCQGLAQLLLALSTLGFASIKCNPNFLPPLCSLLCLFMGRIDF